MEDADQSAHKPMMNPAQRRRWIEEWLLVDNDWIDILNASFVEHYLEASGVKFYAMPYGAHKCPSLSRDLKAMCDAGTLVRTQTSIDGDMRRIGFPPWVWQYRLKQK